MKNITLHRRLAIILGGLLLAFIVQSCGSAARFSSDNGRNGKAIEAQTAVTGGGNSSKSTKKYVTTERGTTEVEKAAYQWVGTPYKFGGTTKDGIDCSAFVMNVLQSVGIQVPRTVRQQWRVGTPIEEEEATTGDLVFFTINSEDVSHVGIYLRNGNFIHASLSAGVVEESLEKPYYRKRITGIRRVTNKVE